MFISARFVLLPQLLILFFSSVSLALVKRQTLPDQSGAGGAEELHVVGFEGSDPPSSSLNEPISAIGAADQQTEDNGGKGVADFAYDTMEEQSPSPVPSLATTSSSDATATDATSLSPDVGDNDGVAAIRLLGDSSTVASSTSALASTEDTSLPVVVLLEEEGSINAASSGGDSSDSAGAVTATSDDEQRQETVVTTTAASSTTRRTAVVSPSKKKDERKAHKKTGQPSATVEAAANDGGDTATTQAAATATQQRNCNSERIRQLIIENIHSKPSVAKRQIQSKVAEEINGKIDVICARHAFSYIVNSELFCEAEHNGVICLCFKQQ